jgi:phosphatidylserine/phosphatidylglycerophosphate/cardiolipin synthase-like enzyme
MSRVTKSTNLTHLTGLTRAAKRRAVLALTAGATAVVTALATGGAAQAAGTYSLLVFPTQSHSAVYDFINSATSSIDVTIYELRDTTAVTDLVNRQKAGVKVRVILDNAHTSVNGSAYSTLKAAGAGVVYSSTAFVYTHQKTLTVDDTKSLILTGNLDSTYYADDRDYGVFDSDAADVAAIEAVFNADYAKTTITPADGDNLVWSPTDSQTRLLALINGAQHSLDVQQLEFGDTALVNAIVAAQKRGVAVRVVGMDPSSYQSQFTSVVTAGGKVVTYSSTSGLYVHAKAIVADSGYSTAKVFAGSENFSDNSLNHNRELGLIISDSTVLSGIESTFATDFAGGTVFTG